MTPTPLVLHVWPGRWNLHSIDANCLEAILFLQLTFPGQYSIVETADPDLSPSGQLPFLTHGQIAVSPLPSIVSYLSTVNRSFLSSFDPENEDDIDRDAVNVNLDAGLTNLQLSKGTAWKAYIEAQLGDLVAHSFFVLEPNYEFTHGTLVSMLPVPQRYYVPRRIRESYRPRLEAVGLWQVANKPESREEGQSIKRHKGESKEDKIRRAFGQAKLVEKARLAFDMLSKVLNDKTFIFTDRPTSIDLVLASRVLLLVHAPLPNPALKDLLERSYPSLVSHAARTHAFVFPTLRSASNPRPQILVPPRVNPLSVLKNSLVHLTWRMSNNAEESEEAKRFRKYRWGWFGLAVVGIVGYIATQGLPIAIVVVRKEEEVPGDFTEIAEGDSEDGLDEDEDQLDEAEMDVDPL